jgi:hypothetical protein
MRRIVRWALCAVLGGGGAAQADVLTVGPEGTYSSIQAALSVAVTRPLGVHEVRVQRGTYTENLRAPNPCCGGRHIQVIGGWYNAFNSRDNDPAKTVIDGRSRGRVFTALGLTAGSLTLSTLTLRGGYLEAGGIHGVATGAGLRATVTGEARLALSWVNIQSSVIRGEDGTNAEAQGAGAMVLLQDAARFSAHRVFFRNNMIVQGGASSLRAHGGGLHLQIFGGRADVSRNEFTSNWAYGNTYSTGGGLHAMVEQPGGLGLTVVESSFEGNVVHSTLGEGAGAEIRLHDGDGTHTAYLQRCRFRSNIGGRTQLDVSASGGSRFDAWDSLVADGRGGVYVLVNQSQAHLTNLTVADNQLRGIQGSVAGGTLTVFNSIAFDNAGGDLSLAGSSYHTGFNLVGIDPRFKNPSGGDYDLDMASPAADAGTNTPPAGIGHWDLALRSRVFNGGVDIGAYEWQP